MSKTENTDGSLPSQHTYREDKQRIVASKKHNYFRAKNLKEHETTSENMNYFTIMLFNKFCEHVISTGNYNFTCLFI